MASREKKVTLGRKQSSASPVPPKEGSAAPEATKPTVSKTDLVQSDDVSSKPSSVKTTPVKTNPKSVSVKNTTGYAKKITKPVGRKAISKTLTLNIKAREKKPVKIKQHIAKTLLNNAKNNLEGKKAALLKNGIKPKRIRRKKIEIEMARKAEAARLAALGILTGENATEKKPVKKRIKKVPTVDNPKKSKIESSNNYSSIDETINSILSQIMAEEEQKITKKPKLKKAKIDTVEESIEDVMKDLTYLIKNEDVKQDVVEPVKTEPVRIKRPYNRKPKVDLIKKKSTRKENMERKLDNITLDASAKHLIDMLDLSVSKTDQLLLPICSNRRHSIEKCSIDAISSSDLLRAPTPRSKRASKVRRSVDTTVGRKNSPYGTRSDVPQLLRNGKHRKKRELLIDGLESRKRKRLCSDFSGSEKSVSKLSGYESDSSFTDSVSFPCSDNMDQKDEQPKVEVKPEIPFKLEQSTQNDMESDDIKTNRKPSFEQTPSTDNSTNGLLDEKPKKENIMDNNSNVCSDVKLEVPTLNDNDESKTLCLEKDEDISDISGQSVSSKVPEKSIILDKMKQTFNDINAEDPDKRTTRLSLRKLTIDDDGSDLQITASQFYGASTDNTEEITCDNENVEMICLKSLEAIDDDNFDKMDFENTDESIPSQKSDNLEKISNTNISNDNLESLLNNDEPNENLALKGDILQALGLQSLKAAEEAKKDKHVKNDYTGTLKTVIKLNRGDKKKGRNSYKLTLQKHKTKVKENEFDGVTADEQKSLKEIASGTWRSHGAQSSDTADGSSEHTSDGDVGNAEGDDAGKVLVIPEKASSFSIHPGRLCKDECSYCFGKFGLFDTPCHIAQMKSVERQDKILQTEKQLTRDSCLCDACYRHVDRKSNTPSYLNKGSKRNNIIAPGPRQNHCHVLGCGAIATNILRRKWLIKMRKSVREVINIDLENLGLHSIPICSEHYVALEHLMVCAMCKTKLARNHIHYLGPEMTEFNLALNEEGIPVKLIDKPVVCKLCRYFASLVMKPMEERSENTMDFFKQYKQKLLQIYEGEIVDEPMEELEVLKEKIEKEPMIKKKKKSSKTLLNGEPLQLEPEVDIDTIKTSHISADSKSSSKSRSESPSDYMVDYNTLIPSIAMDCGSDVETSKRETTITPITKYPSKNDASVHDTAQFTKSIKSKSGSSIGSNKTSAIAVQRLGSNPCISVRQLFPGEEEVGLQGHIEFGNIKEKTPEGWEKCCSVIQYDNDTKLLWQELQKPYGNQSSFLRHLILLEKYFRSGDLILSTNASHHSTNYSESVQNRLRAYDNIPSNTSTVQSSSSSPRKGYGAVSNKQLTSSMSIINAANIPKNTPITISQISNIAPTTSNKVRNPGVPPGLISLHPGTTRPVASSLIKVPQPQKIKIPLTKNWRPNLIPIDPSKASDKDKKPGYVKVMSGGKPYHITMDDYNRMCAIKKSYDLKQKRLLDAQNAASGNSTNLNSSYLRTILPRKGLMVSKNSTVTSPSKNDLQNLADATEAESSLEKLDKTVENLESKLTESTTLLLPKIPKSLTVIPQTVSQKSLQSSSNPNIVTSKPKSTTNS